MAGETPEDAEDNKPKSQFKLIVAAVGVFAILAGGITSYFLFMRPKSEERPHVEAAAAAVPVKPPAYVDVPELLVNLAGVPGERVQYLRVRVTLEVKEEKQLELVKPAIPRVVDIFQTYLRELRASDLNGSVGIFRLKEELTRRVNAALQPNQVSAVLFKEIVIQ